MTEVGGFAAGGAVDIATGEVVERASPGDRLVLTRELLRRAARYELGACLLLTWAYEHDEHVLLGYSSWGRYVDEVGVTRSMASKMLHVGQTFRGGWQALPVEDQAQLNVTRLYVQAQRVDAGQVGREDAMHEAVSTPVHELIARRNGEVPPEQLKPVRCVECGQVHQCPGEPTDAPGF